jgi:4-hydroxy-2-oxoheptanedioate aldolase
LGLKKLEADLKILKKQGDSTMAKLTLKEKMQSGPVFGMTVYTGAVAVVEALGYWGFDFAFLDAEHTPMGVGPEMEKLVMAAKLSGVSPLVRVTGCNEIEIRKALEMGAEGVIIPHVKTKAEAELCVRAAKFPMAGRRGADATVRSAGYAGPGFNWDEYITRSNNDGLVLPMAEDFEFIDNLEEIMDVPGMDAINFGPTDYALSLGLKLFYKMDDPTIEAALEQIVNKAKPRGIGIMAPVVPPTLEGAKKAIAKGVNMLIMGSDMYNFQAACRNINSECLEALRKS